MRIITKALGKILAPTKCWGRTLRQSSFGGSRGSAEGNLTGAAAPHGLPSAKSRWHISLVGDQMSGVTPRADIPERRTDVAE
jgi:hypothetical protein